ncbi:hypothetical protein ACEWPM_012470 [Roseovarius sp. S4756]|uniref:hypothetical protein n=1 Tax=Roseovarius maritimus TaxID=3342637 RepID=UPI00372A59DE
MDGRQGHVGYRPEVGPRSGPPISSLSSIEQGWLGADLLCDGRRAPLIEQTNKTVRRVNAAAGKVILPEARAVIQRRGRLPGINGKPKMSKSGGNAIRLCASPDAISAAVRAMYTDPGHLRIADPGKVEGNFGFAYLDAINEDEAAVADLKAQYRRGDLGDAVIKRRLDGVNHAPIRSSSRMPRGCSASNCRRM